MIPVHNEQPIALICGMSGAAAPYLAQNLLNRGYQVHGCLAGWNSINFDTSKITVHTADLSDAYEVNGLLNYVKPDVIYNAAAISSVLECEKNKQKAFQVNALLPLRLLEWMAMPSRKNKVSMCHFGTINIYEGGLPTVIKPDTSVYPISVYSQTKVMAKNFIDTYRDLYNVKVGHFIMGPNESPRRGKQFLSRKIIDYFVDYKKNGYSGKPLVLGNINITRDWGSTEDYMRAVVLAMENGVYEDFLLGSGSNYSIKNILDHVAYVFELKLDWVYGLEDKIVGAYDGKAKCLIQIDKTLFRNEPENVSIDSSKIRNLGWKPEKTLYDTLGEMVQSVYSTN